MRHLGDITKINGAEVPSVNVVIGGSPCQDLSIAGKRAGLVGERSGLFMEQLRVIKEMRKADADKGRMGKDIRPRFMVWENVPGAFSSNKGQDFGAVLQETARVVCEEAPAIPMPKNGWPTAGCLNGGGLGGEWSIAWRVFDAQFWGVPQRRRRIALVADFGGTTAPEILFERESVSRDSAPCGAAREDAPADAQGSAGADGGAGSVIAFHLTQDPISGEIAPCLSSGNSESGQCMCGIVCKATQQGGAEVRTDDTHTVICFEPGLARREGNLNRFTKDQCPTLRANMGDNQPAVCYPDVAHTLSARHDGSPQPDRGNGANIVVQAAGFKAGQGAQARSIGWEMERCPTLNAEAGGNSIPSVCVRCYDARGNGGGDIAPTMTGDHQNRVTDYTAIVCESRGINGDIAGTLDASYHKGPGMRGGREREVIAQPVFCIQGNCIDRADTAGCNGRGWTEDVSYTLNTIDRPAVVFTQQAYDKFVPDERSVTLRAHGGIYGGGSENLVVTNNPSYVVRRLTPLECERLQGFPDHWTDIAGWIDSKGKAHAEAADSARYKALGNSIAIPPWLWVLRRLALACGADNTMASLFDGIGGFPLIWSYLNGMKKCLWASEIEDFPIAVTQQHFHDKEGNDEKQSTYD